MKVGDTVQLLGGDDVGQPWCTVIELLGGERAKIRLVSGGWIICPTSMLGTRQATKRAAKRTAKR